MRASAVKGNFDGNLVGCTTNSARFYLELGADVFESTQEEVDGIALFEFFADAFNSAVNYAFGNGLFTVFHHHIYEVANERALIAGIRNAFSFFSSVSA